MITLKSKLYTLIKARIGAEVLIFSDANAPRPPSPYWTMRVQSQRRLGKEYYSQGVTALGDQTILGTREATVAIQRFGPDSDIKCQTLVDELAKTTVIETWQAQKICVYETGDVLNISTTLDNSQIEPRAAVDLFIRFGASMTDRVGIIETVNNTGSTDQLIDTDEIDIVAVASSLA